MSFWTTEKLKREQTKTPLEPLIHPYDAKFVKQGAYEMSLGPEAFVTTDSKRTKQKLRRREHLVIPSGQFALLLTEEVVRIPDTAIGFISVRFSLKRRGIVNVSGFHVDPGFVGRLKFAVYNAGSQNIVVSRGDRIFMIWYCDLSERTADLYKGDPSELNEITSRDVMMLQGEIASPAELKKQLDELKMEFTVWRPILIALAVGLVLLILRMVFEKPATPNFPIEGTPSQNSRPSPNSQLPANANTNMSIKNTNSPLPATPESTK